MHFRNKLIGRMLRAMLLVVLLFSFSALGSERAGAQSTAQLQTLLNDTVAQFKLVYRHDRNELHRRYEEVSKAVAAWRASDRTDDNNRRLEAWLRGAIRNSMPGSHAALLPLPTFENRPAPVPPTASEPEHSLLPSNPSVTSPARPILRQPAQDARTIPQQPDNSRPANDEAPQAVTGGTATLHETAPGNTTVQPAIEAPANDELPETDPLPATDEGPDIDELPDVDPLPEIDEDPALIEALGDPFLDDEESAD